MRSARERDREQGDVVCAVGGDGVAGGGSERTSRRAGWMTRKGAEGDSVEG